VKKLFLLLIILLTSNIVFAQTFTMKNNFTGDGNELFSSVIYDSNDNSYVAVGQNYIKISDTRGFYDATIVKYDTSGNVMWKKNFGGDDNDYFNSVTYDFNDHTYIAVGYSEKGSFENGSWANISGYGIGDATIVKFDKNGNVLWKKVFGGEDEDNFSSVTYDSNNHCYIAVGTSYSFSFGTGDWIGFSAKGISDATIVKYDSNGNILNKDNFGKINCNIFSSVTYDSSDDSYVAVGNSYLVDEWGNGHYDATIVKYNKNIEMSWEKNFGGDCSDTFNSVAYDPKNNTYTAVGYSEELSFETGSWVNVTSKGGDDAIIIKYDADGNILNQNNFGGASTDYFSSITYDSSDNSFVVVGNSDASSFGTGDWSGVTKKGGSDGIVIKYDSDNTILKQINFGGSGNDIFSSVAYDNINNSFVTVGNSSASSFGTGNLTGLTAGGGSIDATIVGFGYVAGTSVTGVTINPNTLNLNVGANSTLTATVAPISAINKNITWKSSNTNIATVDTKGKVIGKANGTATITVTTVEGSKTATCTVTVSTPVTGVTIAPTTLNLNVGNSSTLTATIAPTNASNKNVTWASSNTNIATVDTNGKVIAIANGTTTITVTTNDGNKTASCTVIVSTLIIPVKSVTVTPTTLTLDVGDSSEIIATVAPENATNKNVTWKSNNTSVATVDANGKITAKAKGTAGITATTVDGKKTATCSVTVIIPVTGVTINPTTLTLNVGNNSTLTATVAPTSATNKKITWTSSNTSVATVDANGRVTAKIAGTAIITATTVSEGKTATCTVTVVNPVTNITIAPKTLSLSIGNSSVLAATITPTNATNKDVTWSSSNTSIATVDQNGKVTAKAKGTATITVASVDGNKRATCKLTVTIPVTSVTINPTSLTLNITTSSTLKATTLPATAGIKDVVWTSSDINIATVNSSGLVKAIAKGTAIITATTVDGNKTATCTVTVIVPVTSVTISSKTLTLDINTSGALTASVLPANANNQNILWTSSNTKVATVDQNGLVTAIAKGTATITATSVDGKKTATCKVTVKIPVTSVTLNYTTYTLKVGANVTLRATVLPTTADIKNVTWSSNNITVATVNSSGKVVAKAKGTATITVTTVDGNKTANCVITVI